MDRDTETNNGAANDLLTEEQSRALEVQATNVLKPRTPIATRELFVGRWNQIKTLADAVGQPGLHVAIYGERGVGKTSLANIAKPLIEAFDEDRNGSNRTSERIVIKGNANSSDTFSSIWLKLFDGLTWQDDRPALGLVAKNGRQSPILEAFGLSDKLSLDDVRKVVSQIPGSVFIIDEFDTASGRVSKQFTDLMKALSDFSADTIVILVGVSDTVDKLISDHASIGRALVQIHLPRMAVKELKEILAKAEKALSVRFSREAETLIVHISQGLPHYTHLLGLHAVRIAAGNLSRYVDRNEVFGALKEAVTQAQQSVTEKHSRAIHSAHKDALYRQVLVACALTAARSHDALGYFNPGAVVEPLRAILGRDVEVATFNNHLSLFCQQQRGEVLERTGQARAYRFRFRDPLLVPFVFMDALAGKLISDDLLTNMLGSTF